MSTPTTPMTQPAPVSAVVARLYRRRRMTDWFIRTMAVATTAFGIFWLAWILLTIFQYGIEGMRWELFTQDTPPPGVDGGGLKNAIVGSLMILCVSVALGAPLGILVGTFLAEYGRGTKLADLIRFISEILLSAPSVVIGLFVYTLMVRPMGHFSGLAGGVALAIIMLPVIIRTTEEMLRLVPGSLREAALALGAPYWMVVTRIAYRAALPGILTGLLLALARAAGETAPLLFTALNNQYWSTSLLKPMANLPMVIFQFAMSPYEQWHHLAWAGAFIITAGILTLSVTARAFLSKKRQAA
jgi:phosphate transport system permease protein